MARSRAGQGFEPGPPRGRLAFGWCRRQASGPPASRTALRVRRRVVVRAAALEPADAPQEAGELFVREPADLLENPREEPALPVLERGGEEHDVFEGQKDRPPCIRVCDPRGRRGGVRPKVCRILEATTVSLWHGCPCRSAAGVTRGPAEQDSTARTANEISGYPATSNSNIRFSALLASDIPPHPAGRGEGPSAGIRRSRDTEQLEDLGLEWAELGLEHLDDIVTGEERMTIQTGEDVEDPGRRWCFAAAVLWV